MKQSIDSKVSYFKIMVKRKGIEYHSGDKRRAFKLLIHALKFLQLTIVHPVNPFVPNGPFLYPLKVLENLTVF